MKKSKIAIIGLGKLGSAITQELIRANIFSDIYLINRSKPCLESSYLSFSIFKSTIKSKTELHIGEYDFNTIDIVIIAVKEKYDPRFLLQNEKFPIGIEPDVRNIGLFKDLPIILDVAQKLAGYKGTIIILSNPVDLFTLIFANHVSTARVYGLGLTLDIARLIYVANKNGIKCDTNDCYLGGTHTHEIIPLKSLWKKTSGLYNCTKPMFKKLLEETASIGPKIVNGLGYTLHDCAEVFTKDIKWFIGKDNSRKLLCASIANNNSATGWPLIYSDSKAISIYDHIMPSEKMLLNKTGLKVSKDVEILKKHFHNIIN